MFSEDGTPKLLPGGWRGPGTQSGPPGKLESVHLRKSLSDKLFCLLARKSLSNNGAVRPREWTGDLVASHCIFVLQRPCFPFHGAEPCKKWSLAAPGSQQPAALELERTDGGRVPSTSPTFSCLWPCCLLIRPEPGVFKQAGRPEETQNRVTMPLTLELAPWVFSPCVDGSFRGRWRDLWAQVRAVTV